MKTMGIAAAALGALVMLAGCTTEEKKDAKVEVEVKTDAARADARTAGEKMRDGAHDAGAEIKEGAQDAGAAIKEGAQDAGQAINQTKQEVDIRAALALDTSVDKAGINVVGDEGTKTIRLQGTVPTADQKMRAEAIAKDKAEGWTIVNELTVVAPAP
jgi:hyperosmotically inducible periplasmic protein